MIFFPFFLLLFLVPIVLAIFAFWIWMLVDCATKESDQGNDKIIWILVIILSLIHI